MIEHECPECGETIESPDVMAGEEEICPSCGKAVPIPIPIPPEPTEPDPKAQQQEHVPDQTYNIIVRSRTPNGNGQKSARIHGNGIVVTTGDSVTIMITQRFWMRSCVLAILTWFFVVKIIVLSVIETGVVTRVDLPGWLLIAIFYYYVFTKKHVFTVALNESRVFFDMKLKAVFFRLYNGKWIATKCKEQPEKFLRDIKDRIIAPSSDEIQAVPAPIPSQSADLESNPKTQQLKYVPALIIAGAVVVVVFAWVLFGSSGGDNQRPTQKKEQGRLNLQDVGVLPLTSIPNETTKSKKQQNRWPACFLDTHKIRKVTAEPFVPKLTTALFDEILQAWIFFMTQEKIIRLVREKFPDLHDRLSIAQLQFQQKFRPAIDNMDRIVGKQFGQWEKVKKTSIEEIDPHIRNQLEDIKRATAEVILVELENQYKDKIPSPILETLLMFHPTYMKYPEREIIDGFKKEYRSDGSGKALGIKIGLEYPSSWKAKAGRRPHILQKFTSQNGKGKVSAGILVMPIPEEFAEFEPKDVLLQMIDDKEALQASYFGGGKLIDYGLASHAETPLFWIEGSVKQNRVGVDIEMHQLMFNFFHKNKIISLQFMCFGSPGITSGTVLQEFNRHAPLFKSMLNSVDFFDRYSP